MTKSILFFSLISTLLVNSIYATTNNTNINAPKETNKSLPTATITAGLKEALDQGTAEGISTLSKKDGFYKNPAFKIMLPKEFNKVEKTLKSVGLGSLVNTTVLLINRAAENAVAGAGPIFKSAITGLNFNDAMGILLGDERSASTYLEKATSSSLTKAFEPQIEKSLNLVDADAAWENMITKYNAISKEKVNANLSEYVTEEALNGLYSEIGDKEADIRNNKSARNTPLLKEVFAIQDNSLIKTSNKIIKKVK